jgi:protein-tyrosine phosphatase
MLRRIPFEKIENFRDLGGYFSSTYGETSFGVVYRSGSLSDATNSDLDLMAKLGIKSIIDLRNQDSDYTKPDKTLNDPRFHNYPCSVNGNGRVPTGRIDMINSYIEMLEEPVQARHIFLTLAHCEKPCVLHCSAGKDRTGCFTMILLLANGVPFHDVNADYMLSFPYLTRLTRETKTNHPDFPKAVLTPDVNFLKKVMVKFNKKWGTINEYFESIGLDEDEINLLCNLLGKQEKSVGAVVFHDEDILVEHMVQGHYSIPKGHVEACDKDEKSTATREIKEETNLNITFLGDEVHTLDYSPKAGVAKRVVFYLAETDSTETIPQKEEVQDIYWLKPNDAVRTLSHVSDKNTVIWACKARAKIKYSH